VQPWRAETFKFSTDPELVAKVSEVKRPGFCAALILAAPRG
jgi:hypothetical protein